MTAGTATLDVGSTAGFPDTGTILVGNEKMTYTAKDDTSFTIALDGRAADNTSLFASSSGELVTTITDTEDTSITIDNAVAFLMIFFQKVELF